MMTAQELINVLSCVSEYRHIVMHPDGSYRAYTHMPILIRPGTVYETWMISEGYSIELVGFNISNSLHHSRFKESLVTAQCMTSVIELINNRMAPQDAINYINKLDSRFKWLGRNKGGAWYVYTHEPVVEFVDLEWCANVGEYKHVSGIEVIMDGTDMQLFKTTNWFWDRWIFKLIKYVKQ